jgi:hypothetical protein
VTAAALQTSAPLQRLSNALYLQPRLLLFLLLTPPLLWLGVIYLGSLFALLAQSFFYIDEYSGMVVHEFSLATWRQLFTLPTWISSCAPRAWRRRSPWVRCCSGSRSLITWCATRARA